jgi:phosphoribosylformylglycinamidine synthase subunit PurS
VTQNYHAKIYVTLRPSVLDPAGTAVQSSLSHMGYNNVDHMRIGKYIELNLSAESQQAAETQLDRMCDRLLANTVIENYRFELTALTETVATGA